MYITCNNIYIFIIIGKTATPNTITIQATKHFTINLFVSVTITKKIEILY